MGGGVTLFDNTGGAAAGSSDYVKDVFQDVTLAATNNTGFTSTASTNPLGYSFANDDIPKYQSKTLYINGLTLISDRTKWINNEPTYEITWNENFPAVKGYAFGNITLGGAGGINVAQVGTIGDGVAITGVIRRASAIVQLTGSSPASGQVVVDGANTTTIDFSSLANDLSFTTSGARFGALQLNSVNATRDIHDYRVTALQVSTLSVVGFIVYFENTGQNLDFFPGTTYVDKTKAVTTVGTTAAIPAYGSSLGGRALLYKTSSSSYAVATQSVTTVISVAQGSSGTNLLAVTTGTGASFASGMGIVASTGSTFYVGAVTNVSTDTLTVSPTLSFGVSAAIYRAWTTGSTLSFNASFVQLSATIDFTRPPNTAASYSDPYGQYSYYGSNIGLTSIDTTQGLAFLGASGFLQVEGNFVAAEYEMVGSGIMNATLSVNGLPAYSTNAGQTGAVKRTVFHQSGSGFNGFNFAPGSSMGSSFAITKINLYSQRGNIGTTFGRLVEFDTIQSYVPRSAVNATLASLGTVKRTYADQLFIKGKWVRSVGASFPGGAAYFGSTTTSTFEFNFFGKNFALLGSAPTSATLAVDGVGTTLAFGTPLTVASEGFHRVTYAHISGTTVIHAIDFTATQGEIIRSANILSSTSNPASLPITSVTTVIAAKYFNNTGATLTLSTPTIIDFATKGYDLTGGAVTTGSSWNFKAQYSGIHTVKMSVQFITAVYAVGNVINAYVYKTSYASGNILVLAAADSTIATNTAQTTTSIPLGVNGSADIYLNAGETIDIRVINARGGSPVTLSSNAGDNYVTVTYIGKAQ